eukprot:GEZU01000015.1.p1 GENE.GEZU01000015.1~~GEZU01000015.1.p1  ORF type:complete len:636 (+),score=143.52 GEZU01000015.1:184-2091(+)
MKVNRFARPASVVRSLKRACTPRQVPASSRLISSPPMPHCGKAPAHARNFSTSRVVQAQQQKLQMAHVKGDTRPPLIESTIGKFFSKAVETYNTQEMLRVCHQDVRLSYKDMGERVDSFARGLLRLGIRPGDRIGVWMPNNLEWMVTQYACAKIGAVLVNINPAYRETELKYALKLIGVRALVLSPTFKASNYVQMMNNLCPELARYPSGSAVTLAELPDLKFLIHNGNEDIKGMIKFNDLYDDTPSSLSSYDATLRDFESVATNDDPINIQFTSGTTGLPKGAVLTHRNILNNGFLVGEKMRLTPSDSLCIPVPLYHCFGLVMGNLACLTHGSKVVYPSAGFDAEATLKAVSEEKCTALHGVPTMFIAELDHPNRSKYDLSSLRTGIMAGSTCPMAVMKRVMEEMNMREVEIAYGMTETSPVSFQTSVDDPIEMRVQSVGRVMPHTECKVIDPATGKTLPVGAQGELLTKGYLVMKGYWNQPEKTREVIDDEGFMHTGDLAEIDENGYCKIVGRAKDLIIRGGENISPREIEEFLFTHPKIQDVAVIGVPDLKYGEQICAWIIPKKGVSIDEQEVKDFCSTIAHYKKPHYVVFVESFPLTITGKIQKYIMREQSLDLLNLHAIANEVKKQVSGK